MDVAFELLGILLLLEALHSFQQNQIEWGGKKLKFDLMNLVNKHFTDEAVAGDGGGHDLELTHRFN